MRAGGRDQNIGCPHGLLHLGRGLRLDAEALREPGGQPLGMSRLAGKDNHPFNGPLTQHGLHLVRGLRAAAEDRERAGVRAGEIAGRDTAGRAGAHRGQQAGLDERLQRAGLRIEQDDLSLDRGQVALRWVGVV